MTLSGKPIIIVYVIDQMDSDTAGTEKQLIRIINGLNNSKFEIHLICFRKHPWFEENLKSLKCASKVIVIQRLLSLSTYFNFLKLVLFFKKLRPDIVHTFFPVGNIVGVLAAKIAGVRNIISSRRDNGEWMNPTYLVATNFANRYVNKILTNSHQVKLFTEKTEKNCKGKVEVLVNGIDMDLFKNIKPCIELKHKLSIPIDNQVVGILGNFRAMKRHEIFIQAAKEISNVRSDVSFILIGIGFDSGKREEDLKNLAKQLGVDNKLHFVGRQQEIIPFLSILDVGVNCSEMEGLSNAIMEYMAAGVPCVVSRCGGNLDLITHNINGFTFNLDDYKTLANLTLCLLDDKQIRERFIKNSHERVENELSLERMIKNYESFYAKIAKVI